MIQEHKIKTYEANPYFANTVESKKYIYTHKKIQNPYMNPNSIKKEGRKNH